MALDNIKGKFNEAKGDVTGSDSDKAKGKLQQLVGDVKDKAEEVKDKLKDKK